MNNIDPSAEPDGGNQEMASEPVSSPAAQEPSPSRQGRDEGRRRSRRKAKVQPRMPAVYRICDGVTEGVVYFMVLFTPWAFGTTQHWSTWVLNVAGYLLGLLLIVKWGTRWRTGYQPVRWWDPAPGERQGTEATEGPVARYRVNQVITWTLAGLTVLILLFCLVSAANARATFLFSEQRFIYHDCIEWLPHSYDSTASWFIFWHYLALGFSFWAIRDWLLGKTREERQADRDRAESATSEPAGGEALSQVRDPKHRSLRGGPSRHHLPARLNRLLWVVCVNAGILGLEGILQRLSGTNKLLWLVQPGINKTGPAQFGPYAYRGNAAEYFNLVWPVCLGFWWAKREEFRHRRSRSSRVGGGAQMVLLPFAVILAACPIITTSRGGAIVDMMNIVGAASVLLFANRRGNWLTTAGIFTLFLAIIGMAGYLGWTKLSDRLQNVFTDQLGNRVPIYQNTRKILHDFPVWGTGPWTFPAIYELYKKPSQVWEAYVHNDYMETRATFGWVGFSLIMAALLLVPLHWATGRGMHPPWVLTTLVVMAMGGCLVHARFDFPMQVASTLFMFLLLTCVFFCTARRGKAES